MSKIASTRSEQLRKAFEHGYLDENTYRAAIAALNAMEYWESYRRDQDGAGDASLRQSALSERPNDDTITTGNISGMGIAIGRGAQAIVNYFRDRSEVRNSHNRAALLTMTKEFWIEGVLLPSLYQGQPIKLAYEEYRQATAFVGTQTPAAASMADKEGPPTLSIAERFFGLNALQQTLLILGKTGVGKTTTLLEVAQQALERAANDNTAPTPMLFNLSSWGHEQRSLQTWLVSEFLTRYNAPASLALTWLQNGEFILLLDGLDEVPEAQRDRCIQAINVANQQLNLPMVICAESDEYLRMSSRLHVQCEVRIQELTPQAVKAYLLDTVQPPLRAISEWLDADPLLIELITTPLMLNTLIHAYDSLVLSNLTTAGSIASRHQQLLATYVEAMFRRKGSQTPYPQPQTITWLAWLAQQMERNHCAIFLIEELQPAWLADGVQRWAYLLGTRSLFGFVLGALFAAVIALSDELILGIQLNSDHVVSTATLAWFIFAYWLLAGIGLGVVDNIWARVPDLPRSRGKIIGLRLFTTSLVISLVGGLLFTVRFSSSWGIFYGLFFGLLGGIYLTLSTRGRSVLMEIHPVEKLQLSISGMLRGVGIGLLAGALIGFLLDRISGGHFFSWTLALLPGWLAYRLVAAALLVGPVLAMLGIVFDGFRSAILDTKVRPNQGMYLSARNALLAGGVCTLTGWMLAYLYALIGQKVVPLGYTQLQTGGPLHGLTVGLLFGLLAGLWHGGFGLIQHGVLRSILTLTKVMPWNYSAFLDAAVQLALLRRVGGGYIFIHRQLMDYFAVQVIGKKIASL